MATITPVGSGWSSSGVGNTTLNVAPTTLGDALVFSFCFLNGGVAALSPPTGGGVAQWNLIQFTAQQIITDQGSAISTTVGMWLGVVTSTGSSTIVINGPPAGASNDLFCQQFTIGTSATWGTDGYGYANTILGLTSTSQAGIRIGGPSGVAPSGSGEMFLVIVGGPAIAQSTSPYTFKESSTNFSVFGYTAANAPTLYAPLFQINSAPVLVCSVSGLIVATPNITRLQQTFLGNGMFTVPSGVNVLKFVVRGADGGYSPGTGSGIPGQGATVTGFAHVSGGQQFQIIVGQLPTTWIYQSTFQGNGGNGYSGGGGVLQTFPQATVLAGGGSSAVLNSSSLLLIEAGAGGGGYGNGPTTEYGGSGGGGGYYGGIGGEFYELGNTGYIPNGTGAGGGGNGSSGGSAYGLQAGNFNGGWGYLTSPASSNAGPVGIAGQFYFIYPGGGTAGAGVVSAGDGVYLGGSQLGTWVPATGPSASGGGGTSYCAPQIYSTTFSAPATTLTPQSGSVVISWAPGNQPIEMLV